MFKKTVFISLFLFTGNLFAQKLIQGIILDSATLEPVPFVNIAVKETHNGTSSSLNGKFSLNVNELPVKLLVSHVGFRKKEIFVSSDSFQRILIASEGINLNDAVVVAGENPALQLMRKVLDNADRNNPEKNGSFSYTSYNKLIVTVDAPSSLDSLPSEIASDTAKANEELSIRETFEMQHLFLSECVSERKFLSENRQKETILASKTSGFSTPVFSLLSTEFQSFHFYKTEFSLGGVKYVGPIGKQGLNHYHFILRDTFYFEKDTVFAISFYPKNENSKNSMKGILQIHTDGYAVYNVESEPWFQGETGTGMRISQQYRKIENRQWFPEELNTEIIFHAVKIGDYPVVGNSTGKLSNIRLNPEFSKNDFDEIIAGFEDGIENSGEKLSQIRPDSLDEKEKETYHVIDSLGREYRFDQKMKAMQYLFNGFVPIKFLNWDITKLMSYNQYEKFRLSLALRTNDKISKHFSLGGYAAYGFGDKAFKYGGDLNFIFSKRKQIELNFSAKQDIEAASVISAFEKPRYLMTQGYAAFFMNRFDSLLKYEAKISFRALRHFKFHVFANHQQRNPCSDYRFVFPLDDYISLLDPDYTLAEAGIEIKMAIHEKFIETPFGFISNGTKWPQLIFRFTEGISGIYGSTYDYQRITLKLDHTYSSLRWGTFSFSFSSGMISGEAPYHLLFNPSGTYRPLQIREPLFYSMDGFETMRTNEFLADRYAGIHFRYRLPRPIINGKTFRPLLSFTHALAFGKMNNDFHHANLTFTGLNNPYSESGFVIDNLLKSKNSISGMGIGFFYRWGFHQFPDFMDNLAVKISFSFALQ